MSIYAVTADQYLPLDALKAANTEYLLDLLKAPYTHQTEYEVSEHPSLLGFIRDRLCQEDTDELHLTSLLGFIRDRLCQEDTDELHLTYGKMILVSKGPGLIEVVSEGSPVFPSVARQGLNFLGTMLDVVRSTVVNHTPIQVPKEVAEARMAICRACPAFVVSEERCSKCGCAMNAKTTLAGAECPDKLWGKYPSPDATDTTNHKE